VPEQLAILLCGIPLRRGHPRITDQRHDRGQMNRPGFRMEEGWLKLADTVVA